MEFEFDPVKSLINKAKHGMNFEEAQLLWEDCRLKVFPGESREEMRLVAVGLIDDKHWCVVFKQREHALRIISARRARIKEIEFYESQEN